MKITRPSLYDVKSGSLYVKTALVPNQAQPGNWLGNTMNMVKEKATTGLNAGVNAMTSAINPGLANQWKMRGMNITDTFSVPELVSLQQQTAPFTQLQQNLQMGGNANPSDFMNYYFSRPGGSGAYTFDKGKFYEDLNFANQLQGMFAQNPNYTTDARNIFKTMSDLQGWGLMKQRGDNMLNWARQKFTTNGQLDQAKADKYLKIGGFLSSIQQALFTQKDPKAWLALAAVALPILALLKGGVSSLIGRNRPEAMMQYPPQYYR